jgi:cell division septal protein FtsQ
LRRSILGTRLLHGVRSFRPHLPRWLPNLALALLGCVALAWLLGPAFQVRHVEVMGATRVSAKDVANAANLVGTNLFLVDPIAAERPVLALGVPARAWIDYRAPDTAVVRVEERAPSYLWKVDPTLYLVSEDGVVLGPTTREDEPVIVVDADRTPVSVGQKVDVAALQEAIAVTRGLPATAGLAPHYLLFSRELGIVVPLSDGLQVVLGDDQDLSNKLAEFRPIVDAARAQQPPATLVDLRFAGHPYFR